MKFKPMLAVNADKEKLKYPCLYSNKLDGIRCVFKDGKMIARSLKPITSDTLQTSFQNLKDLTADGKLILDGELYAHGMPFTEISHFVRKSDADVPDCIKFNCFDIISNENYDEPFSKREQRMNLIKNETNVIVLKQTKINNEKELDAAFNKVLKDGYEGLILRSIDGPYKCGRSSVTEGYLLKIKPFVSFDAKVIEVIERTENLNKSNKNELGRSFKRNTKDAKKGTGIAAVFKVMYEGVEGGVTLTGNEEFRREIWNNKKKYIGKMIEYKAMVIGMKDFPRHANFMRFRDDRE